MSPALPRRGFTLVVLGWLIISAAAIFASRIVIERASQDAFVAAQKRAEVGVVGATQAVQRIFAAVETLHGLARARVRFAAVSDADGVAFMEQRIRDIVAADHGVIELAILAPDGMLAFSTEPGWQPASFADRKFHFVHARDGVAEVFVSRVLPGLAAGRPSIQVSRPILGAGSTFAGVAVASLDAAALGAELGALARDPADDICILRDQGPTPLFGTTAAGSRSGRASCLGAVPEQAEGAPEGVLAQRRIEGLPLEVHYVVEAQEILAGLAPLRRTVYIVLGGLLSLVLVISLAMLVILEREARLDFLGLLNQTVENLPVAVYRARIDAAGAWQLRYASPGIVAITGMPWRVARGSPDWRSLLDPVSQPAFARFTGTLLAEGSATAELRIIRPDGPALLVRDRARILRRLPGGGAEVSGYIADVTKIREDERLGAEALKLATLGELAAGLAHELNQPLTAVLLSAENAQHAIESGDTSGALRRLERIIAEVERTHAISDHLQRFARGDGAAPLVPVDPAEAWRGALLLVGSALRGDGIEFPRALPAGLPPVTARPVQLEQVLVNLLVNARDALLSRPRGARRITTDAELQDGALVLRLRDSGGGIRPDILTRLFDPFVTTKSAAEGTGLGLAISRSLIAQFGGSIAACNLAEGAEFTLRLPLADMPADPAGRRA